MPDKQLQQAVSTMIFCERLVQREGQLDEDCRNHQAEAASVIAVHGGVATMQAVLQWFRTGQVVTDPRRRTTAKARA